ncbi:MAG TPA: glycosyltransferase [Allosphingosinicella sp.]|nr:glycosyltransferase [Allosphingosinicella sp.]
MPTDPPCEEDTRILLCIPSLVGGGAERQVRLLAPRLVERGLKVSLFSRFVGDDAARLTAAGIACFPIAAAGNHDPRLVAELARAARAARAEVIHTWLTQMDVIGGAVALATRRRWVLSERSSPAGYGGRAKDRARAWLGRFADIVVANSAAGLAVWPDHPRRAIIANGVDFEAIDAAPAMPPERAGAGRPLLVAVARLVPLKRIDAVLRAVARLRPDHPQLLLAIIGEGPQAGALKALAGELGIEGNVLFAGFREDGWSWLKAASAFVSASRFEGQPNAVLEAAAAGTPQVLSDIAMHRDAVGDGGALFVDPDDPDALAAAVAALIERPALARDVAAAARSAVLPLAAGRAADLYAGLYRDAACGWPPLGAGRGAPFSSAA